MAKNLQVNLAFTADTNAAMKNLQTLRNSLNEISSMPFSMGKNISSDLQMAANSAQALQNHLGAAMDVKTGNLNLNKLQSSLQNSNQSLSQLTSGLLRAGTTGEKAFIATYSAIAQSNLQLKKSNTLLDQFVLTMKNTAKWQLSSSLLHGLISGFNDAIGYAKDLNTSLNNIQIVTGQNADQMAEFAKQANKAAKELKATTVAYTDAALIYYQQGLEGDAVTKRADTTVKLANVTGESAETVSQWMTAVWNNFDDGSKSLEYYADVMAKLGAETASSADEIATGFEKFAAVADTVGLSYEYGAAALAAVTSQTRQSADVVGTAFKTLFARIQDLELGKTLDDGTTLGAYSEALNKVGINVKDASGGLKEMDVILDEMGTTWKTLGEDQQVALAKSVAGIRQYTQLIALMENYDYFKELTNSAENASGALQEQSEIYEQSWEAASKNVKASLEGMYNTLIPEEVIIDLTNGLADVVSGFTDVLEAAGGLKTILLLISTVALSKFQVQIASAIDTGIQKTNVLIQNTRKLAEEQGGLGKVLGTKIKDGIFGFTKSEEQKRGTLLNKPATGIQAETQKGLEESLNLKDASGKNIPLTEGFVAQVKSLQQIEQYNTKILNLRDKMTQSQFEELQLKQQQLKALGEEGAANAQKLSDLKSQLEVLKDQQSLSFNRQDFTSLGGESDRVLSYDDTMSLNDDEQAGLKLATKAAGEVLGYKEGVGQDFEIETTTSGGIAEFANMDVAKQTQAEILQIVSNTKQAELEINELLKSKTEIQLQDKEINISIINDLETQGKLTADQAKYLREAVNSGKALGTTIKSLSSGAQGAAKVLKVGETALANSVKHGREMYAATVKNKQIMGQTSQISQSIEGALAKVVSTGKSFGTMFSQGVQGASQFAMGLNMITSSLKQIGEEGISLSNISTLLMGITTTAPGAIKMIQGLVGMYKQYTSLLHTSRVLKQAETTTEIANTVAKVAALQVEKDLTEEQREQLVQEQISNLAKKLGIATDLTATIVTSVLTKMKEAEAAGHSVNTAAIIAETIAQYALNIPMLIFVGILALVLAGVLVLVAAMSAYSKSVGEARQQQIDNAKANLELIDSNQQLSESVSELTDKYKELKEAGESSYETFEELKNQIPNLISSYADLEKALGIDLNIEQLQAAYEYFKKTGDLSQFTTAQEAADTILANAERDTAQAGASAARDKMITAARKGDGKLKDGNYQVTIGGTNTQSNIEYKGSKYGEEEAASLVLKDVMGDMWDGSQIKFDASTNAGVVEGYQKMAEARAAMEREFSAEELAHMDTYRELKRELDEMSEAYGELNELQSKVFASAKEGFKQDDTNYLEQFYGKDGIKTLEEYTNKREELIKKLKEEYDITTQQAEALLASSDAFSQYEVAISTFAEDGKISEDLKVKGTLALETVKNWYNSLPEGDKTLFMGIDFSQIGTLEEAEAKLEEIRETAKRNAIKEEAVSAGFEGSQLEMYSELLAANNKELKTNSSLTDQVALNNLKMNKGLKTLQDNWEDNLKILKSANKQTPEYAAALGEVHDALEEAFGVSVSAEFIEKNLEKINSLAAGDVEVLKELQDEMAKEYIAKMEISDIAINDNQTAVAVEDARKALSDMLDSIDTSLELGEGTTLSGDFLNTVQQMLDAGQITEDQLEGMMRAKGYELNITGWKEVDGPKKTIKQTITGTGLFGLGKQEKTITEQEKIQVPIINGQGSAISGTAAPASVVKSYDESTINFSQTDEGGGGAGTSKKDKEKNLRELNDEVDRYHEIEEVIDDLSKEMDKLSKSKDRAFGKDKVKYMQQELDILEAEAKAQEVLLQQTEDYLEVDKQNLLNHNSKVQFDPTTGNITNYTEIQADYLQRLVNMDPESEQYKKLEEKYQTFKDYAAKYEETYDKFEEARVAANDKANEKIEKQLEMIDYSVEINVEVNDRQIKNLERLLDRLDDDAFDGAARVSNMTQQMQQQFDSIADYTSGIKQILDDDYDTYMSGNADAIANLDLTDAQVQQLKDYTDAIMDSEEAILELRENIESQVITTFETWHDKIEENAQAFEHATSMAESYKNIIDIVGKTRIGIDDAILKDLEDTQLKASQGAMVNAKAQMDTTKKALDEAKKSLDNAANEDDIKFWEETVKQLDQQLMEDQENFTSSWQEALQVAADNFTAQMDRAFEHLEDNLAGAAKSFDELNAHMERQQTAADRFLDAGKQQYELSKLNRQIQKDLDKTDNIKAQKELLALQQEIEDYQTNGVNMSERDLEALQKKYELRLAEIALEEAQNAKSQVRLTRDSQGNFGYVYTADETNIADAEQNYEDKLEENRQLAIEQNQELSDMIVQNRQAMVEALREIRREDYEDEQSYQQALEETARFYQEQEAYLIEETQKAIQRSQEIYNQDYLAYTGWQFNLQTAQQSSYSIMGQNADGWVNGQSELMNKLGLNIFNGVTGGEGGAVGTNGLAIALGSVSDGSGFFGETAAAASTWQENYSNIMEQAGSDADGFKDTVLNALYGAGGSKTKPADGSVNGSMAAASQKIVELEQTASSKFAAVTSSVNTWQANYSQKMKLAKDSVDNLTKSLITLLEKKAPDITVTVNDDPAYSKLQALNKELDELDKNRNSKVTITVSYVDNNGKPIEYDNIVDVYSTGYKGNEDSYDPYPNSAYKKDQNVLLKNNSGLYAYTSYTDPSFKNRISVYNQGLQGSWELDSGTGVKIKEVAYNNGAYWYKLNVKKTLNNGKIENKDVWVVGAQLQTMDTGGYTGEWGPEGRLAMLHQKEIVLNAHDTENFLAAIGIVRDINDQIEKNAIAMQYQDQFNNYKAMVGNGKDTLQQEVHITAEFPNATDRFEIEEAFRTLTNQASQFIHQR